MASLWIFGYGSLIWRPDFPFVEKATGDIRGWNRRFCQASPDHRGVPEDPGRVVTLLPAPGVLCRGVAFRIEGQVQGDTMARLDHREQAGYQRHVVGVDLEDGRRIDAVLYVAGPDNENHISGEGLQDTARVVRRARGPSGDNRTYVMQLARALRAIGADDTHVFDLAALVLLDD